MARDVDRAGLLEIGKQVMGYKPGQKKAQADAEPSNPKPNLKKVGILTKHDPAVAKQLRILAAEQGKTQQQLISEALNWLFGKYGKGPIA